MKNFINYQGGKAGIIDFILSGIKEYTNEGDTILDIFAGAGSVSNALNKNYIVYSNDVESYASTLNSAIIMPPSITFCFVEQIKQKINENKNELILQEGLKEPVKQERVFVKEKNTEKIIQLYENHETVWNSKKITPKLLRKEDKNNLFIRYYGASYFGIEQAIEVDSIIKCIKTFNEEKNLLYACLFFAMKETVFSRDGHMAQPLNFEKNSNRGFESREKSIFDIFLNKCKECIGEKTRDNKNNRIFNEPFETLIKNNEILTNVDLIYADPPYTDMQYSRYYHILNVARLYEYPELTKTKRGYTTGLYTEGRFQSDLSKKSKAKNELKLLMAECEKYDINLALSYAFPQDKKNQATDRYTVSIEELIDMAKEIFTPEKVKVNQIKYAHTNHKNTTHKPVVEYLILCGNNKKKSKSYDISTVKNDIQKLKPTNRNSIYNTHLYWSQKSFNIIDSLIENFTEPGEIIFDPFMGSGVTVLEAVKKKMNRNAIGCDVNEMPIFIVNTILSDSFKQDLDKELQEILKEIDGLKKYYAIVCPKCNSEAVIERIIFDKPERDKNDIVIKAINVECNDCKRTTINTYFQKYFEDMYKKYDYINIDKDFNYVKNSKIAVIENEQITNIFTPRNLKVIDEILSIGKKYSVESNNIIRYVLMSVMHQCKITDKRSNSQWPLWTPKKDCVERNVVLLVEKKLKRFLKTIKDIKKTYEKGSIIFKEKDLDYGKAHVLNKASQDITKNEIEDNSVDLIITDPPYLDQVLYSEYMQLYSPILKLDFNLADEIVVSSREVESKNKDDYYLLLKDVFKICSQKLKKDKIMCLYFHDSNLDVWYQLIKILYELGFDFKGQVHIKKNTTLKNIISPQKSLNGDSILFFNNTKRTRTMISGEETIEEIETNIIKEAKHMIATKGSLRTTELYDNGLMEILITNGWLEKTSEEYKSLIDIFEKHLYWDKSLARWSLVE